MPQRPIGVFDSGIGGLTVVHEIMRQLPKVDDPDTGRILRETPGVALDTAPDGTAYAAWHESAPDGRVRVVLSKSPDGGLTWTTPHPVADAALPRMIPPWSA